MRIHSLNLSRNGANSFLSLPKVRDPKKTAILIFASPSFSECPELIRAILKEYPGAFAVGCSSAGEIFQKRVLDDSASVAIVEFDDTGLFSAAVPVLDSSKSFEQGRELARLLPADGLTGLLVLSDGLKVNGTALLDGINSHLPSGVVVTGGLAGDGPNFRSTWVLHQGELVPGYVTALGFYGKSVSITHGSQGGWDIFGPERVITRSRENVVYEIDGRPALALYKEYLGEKAEGLPASGLLFPLQIRSGENEEKRVVRTILNVDEKEQSMTFAGSIPEGSFARLMKANFDRLIEGASSAASITGLLPGPTLALAISCVGRRLVLGERIEEEVEATLAKLPSGTNQVGFYSYGEISPLFRGENCELHNQTMTMTVIQEKKS